MNLDLTKMDFGGHIASAVQFSRNGMHGFNERIFLGATHNLFYPPMEDFLVNVFKLLSFQDYITSFKIYLIVVLIFFMFSAKKLGDSFKSIFPLCLFHIFFLLLFNFKKDSLFLQGMGGHDLIFTGLSNQFLGSIAFFWICREIISPTKKHLLVILACTIFALLSHIVVGFVALLVVWAYLAIHFKIKELFLGSVIVWASTAFYTLPMLAYRDYMTTNNIFYEKRAWLCFFFSLYLMFVSIAKKIRSPFTIVAFLLAFSGCVLPSIEWLVKIFPHFHYYRFNIYSYFLLTFGIAQLFDEPKMEKLRWALYLLAIIWIVPLLNLYPIQTKIFTTGNSYNYKNLMDVNIPVNKDVGRAFVVDSSRAIGTGVESLLSIYNSDFKSTKGLFWESSYTNNISSSYLVTLLGLPSVLNYFRFFDFTCSIRKCYLEDYFRTYNVKTMIVKLSEANFLGFDERKCFEETLFSGTNNFKFEKKDTFKINNSNYNVFNVLPIDKIVSSKIEAVELVKFDLIRTSLKEPLDFSKFKLFEARNLCVSSKSLEDSQIFLHPKDHDSFYEFSQEISPVSFIPQVTPIPLRKIAEDKFEFVLPDLTNWFILKMAPQPGMYFEDSNGRRLKIFRSYPYTVSYGGGRIFLKFERTFLMILGYIISLLTFLCLIVIFVRNKKTRILFTEVQDEHPRNPQLK
jgi:hypothetical protein